MDLLKMCTSNVSQTVSIDFIMAQRELNYDKLQNKMKMLLNIVRRNDMFRMISFLAKPSSEKNILKSLKLKPFKLNIIIRLCLSFSSLTAELILVKIPSKESLIKVVVSNYINAKYGCEKPLGIAEIVRFLRKYIRSKKAINISSQNTSYNATNSIENRYLNDVDSHDFHHEGKEIQNISSITSNVYDRHLHFIRRKMSQIMLFWGKSLNIQSIFNQIQNPIIKIRILSLCCSYNSITCEVKLSYISSWESRLKTAVSFFLAKKFNCEKPWGVKHIFGVLKYIMAYMDSKKCPNIDNCSILLHRSEVPSIAPAYIYSENKVGTCSVLLHRVKVPSIASPSIDNLKTSLKNQKGLKIKGRDSRKKTNNAEKQINSRRSEGKITRNSRGTSHTSVTGCLQEKEWENNLPSMIGTKKVHSARKTRSIKSISAKEANTQPCNENLASTIIANECSPVSCRRSIRIKNKHQVSENKYPKCAAPSETNEMASTSFECSPTDNNNSKKRKRKQMEGKNYKEKHPEIDLDPNLSKRKNVEPMVPQNLSATKVRETYNKRKGRNLKFKEAKNISTESTALRPRPREEPSDSLNEKHSASQNVVSISNQLSFQPSFQILVDTSLLSDEPFENTVVRDKGEAKCTVYIDESLLSDDDSSSSLETCQNEDDTSEVQQDSDLNNCPANIIEPNSVLSNSSTSDASEIKSKPKTKNQLFSHKRKSSTLTTNADPNYDDISYDERKKASSSSKKLKINHLNKDNSVFQLKKVKVHVDVHNTRGK